MAFKLTKAEDATRTQLVSDLRTKATALEDAIREYNERVAALHAEVLAQHVDAYNEAVSNARDFVEEIQTRAQEEFDGKSERWQEGDKGQAAQSWQEEWAGTSLDDIDMDEPQGIIEPTMDHADTLEGLPEAAE